MTVILFCGLVLSDYNVVAIIPPRYQINEYDMHRIGVPVSVYSFDSLAAQRYSRYFDTLSLPAYLIFQKTSYRQTFYSVPATINCLRRLVAQKMHR